MVYHITEDELTLFLLSCIESMFCFLVESRFSLVHVFCSSARPGFSYGASWCVQEPSCATSFINSAAVIWYRVLFRQNRTDRPLREKRKKRSLAYQHWRSGNSNLNGSSGICSMAISFVGSRSVKRFKKTWRCLKKRTLLSRKCSRPCGSSTAISLPMRTILGR
jgi:hypothetical protein